MNLHEPATFLTDLLLAGCAAWLAGRLWRRAAIENHAARWLSRALALAAASAVIGGGYHGFAPNFSPSVDAGWWLVTLITVSLMSAAMALSWMHEVVSPQWHGPMRMVITIKFLFFAVGSIRHPQFVVAIADYGSTMLAWLAAAAVLQRRWRGWMLAALVLSALAALVQQFRWAPAAWFNNNDLFHVIQALALAAFYRAGCRLGEKPFRSASSA